MSTVYRRDDIKVCGAAIAGTEGAVHQSKSRTKWYALAKRSINNRGTIIELKVALSKYMYMQVRPRFPADLRMHAHVV